MIVISCPGKTLFEIGETSAFKLSPLAQARRVPIGHSICGRCGRVDVVDGVTCVDRGTVVGPLWDRPKASGMRTSVRTASRSHRVIDGSYRYRRLIL